MAEPAVQPRTEEEAMMQAALRIADSTLKSEEGANDAPVEEPKEAAPAEEPKEEVKEEAKEEPKEEPKPSEVRRLKLKWNGEEKEVEEPEAVELAQKGYDYAQKMRALHEERDAWTKKAQADYQAKVKDYDDKLALHEQALWATLTPEVNSTNWEQLAKDNPSEWAQRWQHVQMVNGRLQQIQAERQRVAQENQRAAQESVQRSARDSIDILQKEIPGWNNELYGKILKAGVDNYGFKQEELNAITDSRAVKVLHDAMQYRALMASKPTVEKKVAAVPKVAKPGTAEKPDRSTEDWKQGMAQLQKSGGSDMRAAMDVARGFLKDFK